MYLSLKKSGLRELTWSQKTRESFSVTLYWYRAFFDKIGSLQFFLRWRLSRYGKVAWLFRASQWLIARVWRISRILARGTRSSGSLLLPPPFAFYNGSDLYACLDFQDSALQIKMYYQFQGVFEIVESHRSISICQDAFGIRCSN